MTRTLKNQGPQNFRWCTVESGIPNIDVVAFVFSSSSNEKKTDFFENYVSDGAICIPY